MRGKKEMLKMNLQFFGGRGADSGLGSGSGSTFSHKKDKDIWEYRHNQKNERFVDNVNQTIREMGDNFGELQSTINDVYTAKLSGKGSAGVLAFWNENGELGINKRFANVDKIKAVYNESVKTGFHPSKGNKTAEQAVISHELGHTLTSKALAIQRTKGKFKGISGFDSISAEIVLGARRNSGYRTSGKMAQAISRYAVSSNAECIAEAVSDVYCNGRKASDASKAVVKELKKWLKK